MRNHYIVYIFIFLLLGIFSINFNYIEGDDASTIMYHALGRNLDLQPPYSAYHSMFDKLLSLITTKNEVFLRYFAIGISFVFTFLKLILIAIILERKIKSKSLKYFFIIIPFLIPDILFSGLVINPTNISITFILLAHIFFIKFIKNQTTKFLIASILLFGLGVSFRWVTVFYVFVLFAEYLQANYVTFKSFFFNQKNILKISLIFFSFCISFVLFIQLSGYNLFDIINVYNSGTNYIEKQETSLFAMVASGLAFITPALGLFFIVGSFVLVKQKKYKILLYFIISLFPYFFIEIYPSYKYIITIIIPLLIIVYYGFDFLINKFKYLTYALVFLPWLFGIQLELNSTWGPKFELKNKESKKIENKNFNPDKNVKIKNIKLVFGSGTALPTPEGPRPIYGYGKVLFYDWKEFISSFNKEREDAFTFAKINKYNFLQDVNHSFISSKLIEKEYKTDEYFNNKKENNIINRKFYKENSELFINVLPDKNMLFDTAIMNQFLVENNNRIIVFSSYTNIITKLKNNYKSNFEIKGPYWGILRLSKQELN